MTSVIEEVDKLETLINLPLVLRIGGIVGLSFTIWKGVHGLWPTTGLLGGFLLAIAAWFLEYTFTKSGDGLDNAIHRELSFLPILFRIVGGLVLAVTIWKGVHGFLPSAGIIVFGLMLLVGGMFNKIYK